MGHGWIDVPSELDYLWGRVDKDAYAHYDDPLQADLHAVVPGKLLVFRGPRDLGGRTFSDTFRGDAFMHRDFSPDYFAEMLPELGVTAVVRLSRRAEYDRRRFADRGLQHHDLDFGGGPTPSPAAVAAFFRIVDGAAGVVALHGRESLGRAGTLAALHLMRAHGFAAREAIAWVRVMRPGSVLGEQQHFLARVERAVAAATAPTPGRVSPAPPLSSDAFAAAVAAACAAAEPVVDQRE
jgi:cell division cycle 14